MMSADIFGRRVLSCTLAQDRHPTDRAEPRARQEDEAGAGAGLRLIAGNMTQVLITVATVAIALWVAGLVIITFAMKVTTSRARHHRAEVERRWRGPLEELILHGRVPPPPADSERPVVAAMLVKYLSVVRGNESAAIVAYLEDNGFVNEAIARLDSKNVWGRAEAAEFLGRVRSRKGVAPLVGMLNDPSEDVRTVAARSLATIRDPSSIEALSSILGHPSRWAVSMVADDLMEMGADAVPALLDMLRSGDHATAIAAVKILGEIRDPRATMPVVRLLKTSANLNTRAQAAAALGKLGGKEAQDALEGALRDPAWQVRSQAAKALGRIAAPGTAALLATAIFDENWWVRVNCAEALAGLREEGAEELRRLLQASDRYVRDQCLGVMQQYGLRADPDSERPAIVREASE